MRPSSRYYRGYFVPLIVHPGDRGEIVRLNSNGNRVKYREKSDAILFAQNEIEARRVNCEQNRS